MFLNDPFPGAFGLDIGDLSIKLLQLSRQVSFRHAHTFKTVAARTTTLPPGAIVNGEIQQPEVVRKKILHLLGKDGSAKIIKSPWVVANLPEPKTFLKLIELDTSNNELTDDDVRFQASTHLPFDLDDCYLDWQVVHPSQENSKMTSVLIAAVPKTVADSYTYLLEAAELSPIALEVEAIGLARALITANKDYNGMARAILDLGATRSSLIIYDKNTIQFTVSINFSGELITTAIAQGLGIDHAAADKLKIATGARLSKTYPKYIKIVDGLIGQLVLDIKVGLQFYKEHFLNSNPVTHITMCGGLSNFDNLDAVLGHALHITANPGNAWKNVSTAKLSPAKNAQGLELASAIGLAIRAAENPLRTTL